jgi:hypothetical protein
MNDEDGRIKVITFKYIFQLGKQFMYAEMKYDGHILVEKSFSAIDNSDAERFVNTGSL